MLRLVTFCVALAAAHGQLTATNYQTEDGHTRSENVDPEGNVRGQYSYVDPTGKTITVKYSAGKDGFQVEGDHIPRAQGAPAPSPQSGAQLPFPLFGASQQGLFVPSSNIFNQAAPQNQLTQYSQIPQQTPSGVQFSQIPQQRPAAVQLSQIPTPSRFTPPAGVSQPQQQFSTSPAQFPQSPASIPTSFNPSQLQGFQNNPQFALAPSQLSEGSPQFPISQFSNIPRSSNLALQFPGSPQLGQSAPIPLSQNNPIFQQQPVPQFQSTGPSQFPTAPDSSQFPNGLFTPSQFSGLPNGFSQQGIPQPQHRFN